jgi:hypothetical protein
MFHVKKEEVPCKANEHIIEQSSIDNIFYNMMKGILFGDENIQFVNRMENPSILRPVETAPVLPCETSIEKYNKCIQMELDTSKCHKLIFDEGYIPISASDSKDSSDRWSIPLPGLPIKNKITSHIPF